MASESGARSLAAGETTNERIELEGLETFFTASEQELFSQGLTISQAVYYYGRPRKTLKALIREGKIPAIRLPESEGRKWRLFPNGVPEEFQNLIPESLKKAGADNESITTEESVFEEKENQGLIQKNATNETSIDSAADSYTALFKVEESDDGWQLFLPSYETEAAETEKGYNSEISGFSAFARMTLNETAELGAGAWLDCSPGERYGESPYGSRFFPQIECFSEETIDFNPPKEPVKQANRYAQLQDRIIELEKELADLVYRNNYLETRLSGLEDQLKFMTQEQYRKNGLNTVSLLLPVLMLLGLLLLYRF